MKDLQPKYAERVNFIAVGIDAAESADMLRSYKQSQGYPWTVVSTGRDTLERYKVTSTAIKYGLYKDGTVAFHAGYGVLEEARWRQMFEDLSSR